MFGGKIVSQATGSDQQIKDFVNHFSPHKSQTLACKKDQKWRTHAIKEKTPSHKFSLFIHKSDACVNHTAIKAAPIATAIRKPDKPPRKICQRSFRTRRLSITALSSGPWGTVAESESWGVLSPGVLSLFLLLLDSTGFSSMGGGASWWSCTISGGEFNPFLSTICSTRPKRTETMMEASRASRKTMKKMGMLKRFGAIVVVRGKSWRYSQHDLGWIRNN